MLQILTVKVYDQTFRLFLVLFYIKSNGSQVTVQFCSELFTTDHVPGFGIYFFKKWRLL